MENGPDTSPRGGFWGWLVRGWFALNRRRIRLLQAGGAAAEEPAVYAVSHPAGFREALALSTALDRPVHCLLPEALAPGPLARHLARSMGIILYAGEGPTPEATLREGIRVLAGGESLVVFADQNAAGESASGAAASTAATLVSRAEAQHVARRVAVHPVHLFMPDAAASSQEILIYVDSVLERPASQPAAASPAAEAPALAAALESRFQGNAFQLRQADLEYFLADLEELLRTDLQEDWAGRPEWKQDAEGFVLSGIVKEWVKQTNFLNPGRLVALRNSLDEYRRLQKQCALRQLEIEEEASMLESGWRRALVSVETLLGLPLALYGLANHLLIGLVLFLARCFRADSTRTRTTEWTIRASVTLALYAFQIFLVSHWRGRAAAGYYAPTLPFSGWYLWRYVRLVRPQARSLLISLTIPGLTKKIKRLRSDLVWEIDRALASSG